MFHEGASPDSEEDVYARSREVDNKGIEIVHLDQTFPLFLPSRTTEKYDPGGAAPEVPRYRSEVVLDTNRQLPRLPMLISTNGCPFSKWQAFTPFDPSVGYKVTKEDFDWQTRLAKIRSGEYGHIGAVNRTRAPLALSVGVDEEKLEAQGIILGNEGSGFQPAFLRAIKGLRLQVSFPSGVRLESRPIPEGLTKGFLVFDEGFYPIDTGRLARSSHEFVPDISEGLSIALPANRHDLGQIQGRFVLSPDENGSD